MIVISWLAMTTPNGVTSIPGRSSESSHSPASRTKTPPRDYGIRSPFPVRALTFLGYADFVRRGAMLLVQECATRGGDPAAVPSFIFALELQCVLYVVDIAGAAAFRWISHQGVHTHHIYEHHIPGLLMIVALILYLRQFTTNDGDGNNLTEFAKLLPIPACVGIVAHFCEIFFVLRTFLADPDARIWKVIQRGLGLFFMSFTSLIWFATVLRYLRLRCFRTGTPNKDEEGCLYEYVVMLVVFYFSACIQPRYARSHARALRKLLWMEDKKRM